MDVLALTGYHVAENPLSLWQAGVGDQQNGPLGNP